MVQATSTNHIPRPFVWVFNSKHVTAPAATTRGAPAGTHQGAGARIRSSTTTGDGGGTSESSLACATSSTPPRLSLPRREMDRSVDQPLVPIPRLVTRTHADPVPLNTQPQNDGRLGTTNQRRASQLTQATQQQPITMHRREARFEMQRRTCKEHDPRQTRAHGRQQLLRKKK